MQCNTGDKCSPCVVVSVLQTNGSLGGLGGSYKLILTEAVSHVICEVIAWRENIELMVLGHSLAQQGNGPHN